MPPWERVTVIKVVYKSMKGPMAMIFTRDDQCCDRTKIQIVKLMGPRFPHTPNGIIETLRSLTGFLEMNFVDDLSLLDWTSGYRSFYQTFC